MSITLVSNENIEFKITREMGNHSVFLKNIIDESEPDEDIIENIEIPQIKGEFIGDNGFNTNVLRRVVEFLEHEVTDGYQKIDGSVNVLANRTIEKNVPEWYANYIKQFTLPKAVDLCIAADYFYIPNLLELCAIYIAINVIGLDDEKMAEKMGEGLNEVAAAKWAEKIAKIKNDKEIEAAQTKEAQSIVA